MEDLALPRGSLILVTGATGYIASHIIQEALNLGYRVRGTLRTQEKAKLATTVFDSPLFTAHVIEDLTNDSDLDQAVLNCRGIIHTASNTSLSPDPNAVIPKTVAIATLLLKAAKRSSACQRFVFTSSASAAAIPTPDTPCKIDKTSWNDESIETAWASKAPYKPDGFYHVYAASKAEAEKAVWKFVEEEKPNFVVNTIVPNTNIGRVLFKPPTSSASFTIACLNGKLNFGVHAQWFINVDDNARIHLAALLDKTVKNERIFAYAQPFHWNDLLEAVRKVRPHAKTLPDPLPPNDRDLSEVDNHLGESLLQKWFNQTGYKTLEESVRENLEGYGEIEAEKLEAVH